MRQAGNVAKADIMKGPDGRSKGCGVVCFENARDAKYAITTLNSSMLDGREIFVQAYNRNKE
jgi:RNA recognition motif-containing protein